MVKTRHTPAVPIKATAKPATRNMAVRTVPEIALDAVPKMSITGMVPIPSAAMSAPPMMGFLLPAATTSGA